ncbi:regulator of chromosome condensation [Anaeramoeba flamelloides]|uniref:Regulator of chromosome condensation n=1 Tax=Anaeramoeba flamelloides TaxID=1746091 RepID=A0AAV8A8E7_9EUKA|nr:regulator of chromosome condensation [Anaeramoeba flamelloides]
MQFSYYLKYNNTTLKELTTKDPETNLKMKEGFDNIERVAGGEHLNCYLTQDSQLLYFNNEEDNRLGQYPRKPSLFTNKIIKMSSGRNHILILDEKGKVYSIHRKDHHGFGNIGTGQPQYKDRQYNKPLLVEFFEENDLFVNDIVCGLSNSYFLCSSKKEQQRRTKIQNQNKNKSKNKNKNKNPKTNTSKNKNQNKSKNPKKNTKTNPNTNKNTNTNKNQNKTRSEPKNKTVQKHKLKKQNSKKFWSFLKTNSEPIKHKPQQTPKKKRKKRNPKNPISYSLYSCGVDVSTGTRIISSYQSVYLPEKVSDQVTKVFSGTTSRHFWYFTLDNKIIVSGKSIHSKYDNSFLGSFVQKPEEIQIKNVQISEIKEIKGGYSHSLLLTKKGELLSVGQKECNGLNRSVKEFTKIEISESINDVFVYQMGIGYNFNLILTNQGIYYWGKCFGLHNKSRLNSKRPKKLTTSEPIDLRDYYLFNSFRVFYLIPKNEHPIVEDFSNLFQSKELSDDNISSFPVHKIWVEIRIGKSLNAFQNWIKKCNFEKDQILDFLNWIYLNKTSARSDNFHLQLFFNEFINNNKLIHSSIIQSLINLYQDENSKNFFIKVPVLERGRKKKRKGGRKKLKAKKEKGKGGKGKKQKNKNNKEINEILREEEQQEEEEEEEQKQEEEEEEEKKKKELVKEYNNKNKNNTNDNERVDEIVDEAIEEIPVHDFILFARSGLYRAFFDYIKENQITNKVKDYSEKSISTLRIFIKFLYFDKLIFTKDDDIKLVIEELSDASEYYQLNPRSKLVFQINQMKKKFKLH